MNVRIVSLTNVDSSFEFIEDGEQRKTITLEMGWEVLISRFFKHEIHSEADIEYAITEIEDQLETKKELVNQGDEDLICFDPKVKEALAISTEEARLSVQDVENEFTKYALMSMGQSTVLASVEMNHEKYMIILLIREILNHLKFPYITLKSE